MSLLRTLLGSRGWLGSYVATQGRRKSPAPGTPIHVLLCITDHYEPLQGNVSSQVGLQRVQRWSQEYPEHLGHFRDSDGRPPQHSFFYPIEQYTKALMDPLAELCRAGYGEVEVHLHHEGDHREALRVSLTEFKRRLYEEHSLLSRDRVTEEVKYAFIHGNWALDNSLPGELYCGVKNEIDILRETGCYADFTLPSAPSLAQTRQLNDIYYAKGTTRPKSHDTGWRLGTGPEREDCLLMIQGPLVLDWGRRKRGWLPTLENGCLQGNQPLSIERLRAWLRARVQVSARPDWFFIKLYSHGAVEANAEMLLGAAGQTFHRDLRALAANDPDFHFHYVSAREMFNLAKAAEAGWKGTVAEARDYRLLSNISATRDLTIVEKK